MTKIKDGPGYLWMLKIKTAANIIFLGATVHFGKKATKL